LIGNAHARAGEAGASGFRLASIRESEAVGRDDVRDARPDITPREALKGKGLSSQDRRALARREQSRRRTHAGPGGAGET
jgi:hypothetical protein